MSLSFVLSPYKVEGYIAHSETWVELWSESPLLGHFLAPPKGDLPALEFGPR